MKPKLLFFYQHERLHTDHHEKNRILTRTMKSYLTKLDNEFLLVNKTAMDFLVLAKKYNLNQPSFTNKLEKLEFLKELTTSDFINLLKEGDVNKLL